MFRSARMVARIALVALLMSAVAQAAERPRNAIESPDGSRIVYVAVDDGDTEIFVAQADGREPQQLTDNQAREGFPVWSPDSTQLLFISDSSGLDQVHVMHADGSHSRQLTKEDKGAQQAAFGPAGHIAYMALRDQQGKLRLYDLIVRDLDGSFQKTIAQRKIITNVVWRSDDQPQVLAYGSVGQLVFVELENDTESVVRFVDFDERIRNYGVFQMRWSPDQQSIICRLGFYGGRRAGSKMFGDDEVFVITRAGNLSWSKVEERSQP